MAKPKRRHAGLVYVMQAGNSTGPIKIGFTTNLPARLIDVQCGNAEQVRVVRTALADRYDEANLHHEFREDHIRGEWFRYSERIAAWLEQAPRMHVISNNTEVTDDR